MSRAKPYFTGATMTRALLFALLATTATSVWAQGASDDTSAEEGRQREQIVVTGRRPDGYRAIEAAGTRDGATLLETPQSVQVLTEELLRDQRADTFSALANVPSVRNAAPANFDGLRVQVRGFFSPQALDGMVSKIGNGPGANLGPDLTGIDRVEVLLGPASLLFGNSAPGGTINFVSKLPQAEAEYFLTATGGSYDFYRAEADLTGPVDKAGNLLYRLSASFRDQGSFLEGANTRNTVVSPSVSVRLGERTLLTVDASYRLLELDRQNFGLPAVGTILPNPNGRIARSRNVNEGSIDVDQHRIGYRLTHDFGGDWRLSHAFRFVGTDYVVADGRLPQTLAPNGRTLPRSAFDSTDNYTEYQSQTSLRGSLATGSVRHELLGGLDLSRSTARFRFQGFVPAPPIDVFNPVYGQPRGAAQAPSDTGNRLDELGVFVQDRIVFSEQISLVVGGRFDTFRQRNSNNLTAIDTVQTGDAFSPRLGLIFQPRSTVSLYANYSKSFQPQIGRDFAGNAFVPTRGEQIELGAKANVTPTLAATAAVYRIVQSNVITPDPVNVGFSVQEGEQRSQGVEFGLSGQIIPGWNVATSYAYLDAKTTRSNTPGFVGRRVQRTSPHNFAFWSTYELQSGPLAGLGFGGGAYVVSDRPVDNANSFSVPGYTSLDAVLFYKVKQWRFALNAKNLTDEFAFDAFSANRVTYGVPRTVEFTASWAF